MSVAVNARNLLVSEGIPPLIALDSVNQPKDQIAARKLIAARVRPKLAGA